MSWFHSVQADVNCELERDALQGVTVERRHVLRLSLRALGALAVGWPFQAVADELKTEKKWNRSANDPDLSWSMLIEQLVPMAERLIDSPTPDEDAYLGSLRGLVTRLTGVPSVLFPADSEVASMSCLDHFPVSVVQFKLGSGAAIPYHDHRDYDGVLCAIAGAVHVRSFEIIGTGDTHSRDGSFFIRLTREEQLSNGGTSSLSRTKNNIHDVRAGPQGARLIDFFTFFHDHARSVYLNVNERRRDLGPNVYEANWIE